MIEQTITRILNDIRLAKDAAPVSPNADTPLYEQSLGLGLDSLDTAELSIRLELEFGFDPYSKGVFPQTFGELVSYYPPQ